MDKDGTVRLGDFGVAATPTARDGDWCVGNQQRNTFVGTVRGWGFTGVSTHTTS